MGRWGQQVNRLLARGGLELSRTPGPRIAPWVLPGFWGAYERFGRFSKVRWEGLYDAYQAALHVEGAHIPGAVVECGVWRGGATLIMAEALASVGSSDRPIYLFDTFAGMTDASIHDVRSGTGERATERFERSQKTDGNAWNFASLDEVQGNARRSSYPYERFVFVQGMVQKTIPATTPEQIALLRLDTDFYDSTLHELEHLYPLLAPGGLLLVDDYGAWAGARRAVDEYFQRVGGRPFLQQNARTGGVQGVKPSR